MNERQTIVVAVAPGVLEGPYASITIGEVTIEIWTRVGCKNRIDGKRHGKLAREAAEKRQPHHPNPCLVPLDDADEDGRNHVYAKITVDESRIAHKHRSIARYF